VEHHRPSADERKNDKSSNDKGVGNNNSDEKTPFSKHPSIQASKHPGIQASKASKHPSIIRAFSTLYDGLLMMMAV